MRYSLILASFAVAAFAAPIAQLEVNAVKREPEAQMGRQPSHADKPGSTRPPPRMTAAGSFETRSDIKVVTDDQETGTSARSAEAKSGKPPRPPCNNRNCPDYPGGRGRRSANPTEYTPGIHARDRRPSGASKPMPKSGKSKPRSPEHTRPVRSAAPEPEAIPDRRPGRTAVADNDEDGAASVEIAGNRTPRRGITEVEPEAAPDATSTPRHTRPVRSAAPEPEAIPDRRPSRSAETKEDNDIELQPTSDLADEEIDADTFQS